MNKFLKIGIFFLVVVFVMVLIGFVRNFRQLPLFGPGIQDFTKSLTGNYNLYRNSSNDVFIAPNDGFNSEIAIIPSKVIKVNTYDNFIIAERQALKKRNPHDSLDGYQIPDKNNRDFWILNTHKNYVLKNLKFVDYKRKLDSLHIPVTIELVDIYEY